MNYYFVGLLIACACYALIAGGWPERVGAAMYAISCGATQVVYELDPNPLQWTSLERGVLVIDAITFATFVWLALRADRFWPIWVAALLGLGVLGHLARIAEPDMLPRIYAFSIAVWSYPILAAIVIGTFNYSRSKRR